ncbi:hypothetical protein Aple_071780 [Acrocarpospora pleiomorpha]|uniref:Uncharacterized protein n=1 Tax=Acrocarpospora pleiomorpha TaxID=90975 RepID=A0A5M3XW35_9ACTN|nr:hypothetical protein Aple_071780 [Acrocarpospora pleiomorpha]
MGARVTPLRIEATLIVDFEAATIVSIIVKDGIKRRRVGPLPGLEVKSAVRIADEIGPFDAGMHSLQSDPFGDAETSSE